MDILFLVKAKPNYNPETEHITMSTGLYNSAFFICNQLKNTFETTLEVVIDANQIDNRVYKHKPKIVIIEALWVTPAKLNELQKLHPAVKWIIRIHSNTPFIANEGMAFDWIIDYHNIKNVYIAPNDNKMYNELLMLMGNNIILLSNFYPLEFKDPKTIDIHSDTINISSFGSIRPLKNQLIQSIAAIKFANDNNKKLNFHINCNRIEQNGNNVLKNMISIFRHVKKQGHNLIMHDWLEHDKFLTLCSTMDIGMQISFSETFNIVLADHLKMGVAVIGMNNIPYLDKNTTCNDVTSVDDIVECLNTVYFTDTVKTNQELLKEYSKNSLKQWINEINNLKGI